MQRLLFFLILLIIALAFALSQKTNQFILPTPTVSTSPVTTPIQTSTATALPTSDMPFPLTPVYPPDGGYVNAEFSGGIVGYPTHFPAMAVIWGYEHESGTEYYTCSGMAELCPNNAMPPPVPFPEGDYAWSVRGCRTMVCSPTFHWHFTVDYDFVPSATP